MDLDDSCDMTRSEEVTSPFYIFYWHSNTESENSQQISQFGTVPLSCHVEQFQVETQLSISAPADIVEVGDNLDFSSLVKLTIKMDPSDESPRILTDMTSSPALTNYQKTSSAEIADHMELALEGNFQNLLHTLVYNSYIAKIIFVNQFLLKFNRGQRHGCF